MSRIPILVADDHPLVRAGIANALEGHHQFQVVAEAGDGDEVTELVQQHRIALLILDLKMRGPEPDQLIRKCREVQPDLKVLVFSAHTSPAHLESLRNVGVQGFVRKEEGPASLLQAVRVVLSGTSWYSPGLREKLRERTGPSHILLTSRERDILTAISQGKDNQAIADALGISKPSVRRGLTELYAKLGVKNRVGALLWMREE